MARLAFLVLLVAWAGDIVMAEHEDHYVFEKGDLEGEEGDVES